MKSEVSGLDTLPRQSWLLNGFSTFTVLFIFCLCFMRTFVVVVIPKGLLLCSCDSVMLCKVCWLQFIQHLGVLWRERVCISGYLILLNCSHGHFIKSLENEIKIEFPGKI